MEHYIFSFTAVIVILTLILYASICLGNQLDFPGPRLVNPTTLIISYPSMFYQMWYWSGVLIFKS